jgi:hypothetical protein
MRTQFALLVLSAALGASAALHAQSLTFPISECVWRAGDDPAWAAPDLDESSWLPPSAWTTAPRGPHIWLRCHASLAVLSDHLDPALQIQSASAYELYVNGHLLAASGDIRSGRYSQNLVRNYSLPAQLIAPGSSVIALRQTYLLVSPSLGMARSTILAGDLDALQAERDRIIAYNVRPLLLYVIGYSILGVIGIVQLGLFYYDRSRRDLLLLSLICIGLAILRVNEFCSAALFDYPMRLFWVFWLLGNAVSIAQVGFFFALARRRIPVFFWILLIIAQSANCIRFVATSLPADSSYWLMTSVLSRLFLVAAPCLTLIALAPFLAMLPFSRLPGRIRGLATLCLVWGVADFVYFFVQLSNLGIPGLPNLFVPWRPVLLEARAITSGSVILVLLLLLFRDQRRIVEERATLAGELLAAREIQRLLAPASVPTAPGFALRVAFHPMREVGGDFYLCRVLPDGRQRLLVGDVSGKGAAAAMTAALLLGGAEGRDSDSPARLLTHLNLVLRESRIGGFATCLCADFNPDGLVTLANAGHIPPYFRSEEIAMEPHLPLGVHRSLNPAFSETALQLAPGDTLTFLSDGVVEARNQRGEFFGFDRTREISCQSAEFIAQAAQNHGQEDDITVLTLTIEATAAHPPDSVQKE